MINIKNIKYLLILLLSSFLLFIFFFNLIYFSGNKFIYFFFSLLSFYLLLSIFFEKKYFTEIFLGIYLWLGYWWKFSYLQFSRTLEVPGLKSDKIYLSASEGFTYQVINANILNDTFISLIIAFSAIIISFKLFKLFNKDYFDNKYFEEKFFINLYRKFRFLIIMIFIFLFIFISFTNLYFGIYQKGMLSSVYLNLSPIIINIYKWLILFGLSFIGSIILFYEIQIKSKNFFFISLILFFENFLIATSNLSRAMIVNSSAILYGIYKSLKFENTQKKKRLISKLSLIVLIFFSVSLLSVIELRKINFHQSFTNYENFFLEMITDSKDKLKTIEKNLQVKDTNIKLKIDKKYLTNSANELKNEKNELKNEENELKNKENELKNEKNELKNEEININIIGIKNRVVKFFQEILYLVSKRWVGMESMVLVTKNNERNFNTLINAFDDRFSKLEKAYYEEVFIMRDTKLNNSSVMMKNQSDFSLNNSGQYVYGVITPGFISFLHYANNKYFLFLSVFLIIMIFLYIEKFISFMTSNNLILVSFLSHILVYRLIHFGYLPHQTYLLLGTILVNLVSFYCFKKIYLFFKIKKI